MSNLFLETVKFELNSYIDTLNLKEVTKAKELIIDSESKGGRVHITGIGKPSYVAGYIASLLSSTGTPAFVLHGTEAVHGSSGQVNKGDVVIAISNSGETEELKATVLTLLSNGAKIISCTSNDASWLAKHSSVTLIAGVNKEGDDMNRAPRASILAETLVLQCLSVELQKSKNLNDSQYVKWHPGGSLGNAIREEKRK